MHRYTTEVGLARHREPALEQADGLAEVPLEPVQVPQLPEREPEARAARVTQRLSEADRFLPVRKTVREGAAFGQGASQPGPGHHHGKPVQTAALAGQIAVE